MSNESGGNEVLEAVEALRPMLAAGAIEGERMRRVPEVSIQALEDAGVFRMSTPRAFGGLEAPLLQQVKVLAEIARSDVSTSWVASLHSVGTYFVAHYPDRAQEEVFTTPDTRVASIFSPGGTLTPVDGGYLLSGRWPFNTGCRSAQWDTLAALVDDGDGSPPRLLLALLPMEELTIEDDWQPSGLAATGSNAVRAERVFVAEHRTLPLMEALRGLNLSAANAATPLYRAAFFPFVLVASMGTPVGAALGAMDVFLERLPARKITYTQQLQAEAQVTHVTLARSAAAAKAAALLRDDLARRVMGAAESGRELTTLERAEIKAESSEVVRLSREAVRMLFEISTASSIQQSIPIQRFARDIEALSLHGALAFNTNFEVHGRMLAGLEPGTPFL